MIKTSLLVAAVLAGSRAAAVMRARREPFDRPLCETFILGAKGRSELRHRLAWLGAHQPIAFKPNNARLPRYGFHDGDPAFVIYNTGDLPPEEQRKLLDEAEGRMAEFLKASEAAPSAPLSPLQAAALGVDVVEQTPADRLVIVLVAREPGRLKLETYDGHRVVGTVELDAAGARLGYRGDPGYWIFNELQEDDRRDLTIENFLEDRGMLAFSAASHDRPVLYTFAAMHFDESDGTTWTEVHAEIYTWRDVDPGLAEEAEVQVPPLTGPGGRARRMTSIGLRMNRIPVEDAP